MVVLTEDFYVEFDINTLNLYTTQVELANYIGVDRASIIRYNKMLKILLPDYKADSENSMPLSRYQCWVLIRVKTLFRVFRSKAAVTAHIKKNAQSFSVYRFNRQFPQSR